MSAGNTEHEPVTFVDKRRIDPQERNLRSDQTEQTGEVRDEEQQPEPVAGTGTAPQPGSVDTEDLAEAISGDEAEPTSVADEDVSDEKDAKIAELTDDLKRLHAEYANYRRRQDRERQSVIDNAKASVLNHLLPVLDDLDRARAHGDLESGPLKAVADKLGGAFDAIGVQAFGTEGEPFDPAVHEAVQHEGDGSNPVLGVVMRRGYRFGEKVLRTAMVGVVDAVPEAGSAAADAEESGADAARESASADTN
ncbi:MAG: nucleotide exchange factor GrpE [Aldersonia sp.]|nr:nucleotide exchange factor GrpE [Aldersonia sp.]